MAITNLTRFFKTLLVRGPPWVQSSPSLSTRQRDGRASNYVDYAVIVGRHFIKVEYCWLLTVCDNLISAKIPHPRMLTSPFI